MDEIIGSMQERPIKPIYIRMVQVLVHIGRMYGDTHLQPFPFTT